jgi:hypothetical protein
MRHFATKLFRNLIFLLVMLPPHYPVFIHSLHLYRSVPPSRAK